MDHTGPTVLIAAGFCMFNRCVNGVATWQPDDPPVCREIRKQTAELGYAGQDWNQLLRAVACK